MREAEPRAPRGRPPATALPERPRPSPWRWAGVRSIVSFNRGWYVAVVCVLAASGTVLAVGTAPKWLLLGAWAGVLAGAWFLVGSLVAAHWIYDRSDLHRFAWLHRALTARRATPGEDAAPSPSARVLYCHAGYDECSVELRARLSHGQWRSLDHFDPATMREPSIRRARALRPADAVPAPFDAWPVADGWADVVFAVLAIHELRRERERAAWFTEARRCLTQGGRIVLVEHARDLANLLAFGPGFLHFQTVGAWRRAWQAAGLRCLDEFRITPLLRAFVLDAPGGAAAMALAAGWDRSAAGGTATPVR